MENLIIPANTVGSEYPNTYISIYREMVDNIIGSLTVGREDNDLMPFTEERIDMFITANAQNISNAVIEMMNDYIDDDEYEDLNNREADWVREYVYEHVNIPDNQY